MARGETSIPRYSVLKVAGKTAIVQVTYVALKIAACTLRASQSYLLDTINSIHVRLCHPSRADRQNLLLEHPPRPRAADARPRLGPDQSSPLSPHILRFVHRTAALVQPTSGVNIGLPNGVHPNGVREGRYRRASPPLLVDRHGACHKSFRFRTKNGQSSGRVSRQEGLFFVSEPLSRGLAPSLALCQPSRQASILKPPRASILNRQRGFSDCGATSNRHKILVPDSISSVP